MGIAKKVAKTGMKLGVAAGIALLKKEDIEHMLKVGVRLARLTAKEAEMEIGKVLRKTNLDKKLHRPISKIVLAEAKKEKARLISIYRKEFSK